MMEPVDLAAMSVRELIAALSEVDEGLRRARQLLVDPDATLTTELDVTELIHRAQLIAGELRRRARSQQLGWRPGQSRQPL